jgi:hypothetical protein
VGGPVFDQYGLLVGIICTSLNAEDPIGPSYISLLWPALTLPIDAEWPYGIHTPGKSLWEFGLLCPIDRKEVFRRVDDALFEYTPWEDAPDRE